MRRKNIIAAIVLMAFAVVYGGLTAFLPVRTLPNTPDSAFFPWIITVIIAALSFWLLVRGLKQEPTEPRSEEKPDRRLAVWALGVFAVYLALMPKLGFILATLPFFAIMMFLYGERRAVWIGVGTVSATFLMYVLFRHGFGVFLPRGLLAGIVA